MISRQPLLRDGAAAERREDLSLLRTALDQGWDIPQDVRTRLVGRMAEIMTDPSCFAGTQIEAAKTLVALGGLNLKAVEVASRCQDSVGAGSVGVQSVASPDELASSLGAFLATPVQEIPPSEQELPAITPRVWRNLG